MSKSFTVFLVDDDADDTLLFNEVLNEVNPGVKLISATNGQEALSTLNTIGEFPDLIFLDLNMPRMDGKECLRLIKTNAEYGHIPVFMYSTSSMPKDIQEAIANGAACFITKPSSLKELKHILSTIISSLPDRLDTALKSLSMNAESTIVC